MSEFNNFEKVADKEIFRQQLELLAESSKNALPDELCHLTMAMIELYKMFSVDI